MNKKLQVFVSSTYTDLVEERQAAVEAILDAGHIPAGMELFKAGNESQLKTIYKWIDESDVYMLILGGRYGSIESNSGKSYIQLEYEYALSKDIPVFAVVLSESFLTDKVNFLGLSNVIEQKSPDKYQIFKTFVMSKIVGMVDDLKDIKITIHSTLNEFINTYSFLGWTRYTSNSKYKYNNYKNAIIVKSSDIQWSKKIYFIIENLLKEKNIRNCDFLLRDALYTRQTFYDIYDSDIIIADITDRNPDVYMCIGIAIGLHKKYILVRQEENYMNHFPPFCLVYSQNSETLAEFQRKLSEILSL